MTTVYIDEVFLLNAVLDYLLLLCSARLAGEELRRGGWQQPPCWGAGMPLPCFCRGGAFSPIPCARWQRRRG